MRCRFQAGVLSLILLIGSCGASEGLSTEQDKLISEPWALLEGDPEDTVIRFLVPDLACEKFDHLEVDEGSSDEILVTAWARIPPPSEESGPNTCTLAWNFATPTFTLSEPVGTRSFVHAPVSAEADMKEIPERFIRDFRDIRDFPPDSPTASPTV